MSTIQTSDLGRWIPRPKVFPEATESEFQSSYTNEALPFVRRTLGLSILSHLAFLFWDLNVFPDVVNLFWFIRLGIVIPAILLIIWMTRMARFQAYWQYAVAGLVALNGLPIIVVMPLVTQNQLEAHFYPGLQIVVAFGLTAARLQFQIAAIVTCLLTLVFVSVIAWIGVSYETMLSCLFFLGAMLIQCLMVSYLLEVNSRQSFRLRRENDSLIESLAAQKEAAEAADQSKTRFLAAASHDLRQPLHTAGLLVELLEERQSVKENQALAGNALQAVRGMESLIGRLLDVSRLDAGVVKASIEDFSVTSMFDTLRVNFAVQAQAKGIRLDFVRCQAWVRSDPFLLERILSNLLDNAIEYTQEGRIVVGARRRGGGLRIEVIDTGFGIDAGSVELIFDEFYQIGHPLKTRGGGLGIGLAIAKRSCDLLGHRLSVQSTLGSGSCFGVELPFGRSPGKLPVSTLNLEASAQLRPMLDLGGIFVLVIDDDQGVREATQSLLESWGCMVVCAESAALAITELKQCRIDPDLLICDFRLGLGQNGVEAIAAIQAHLGTRLPVLVITGELESSGLVEVLQGGASVARKPVGAAQLRVLIERLLEPSGRGQ